MKNMEWKWWQYGVFALASLAVLLWCGSYLVATQPYAHNYENERTFAILGLAVGIVFFPHALSQFVRTAQTSTTSIKAWLS